jgi:hypothetical protein
MNIKNEIPDVSGSGWEFAAVLSEDHVCSSWLYELSPNRSAGLRALHSAQVRRKRIGYQSGLYARAGSVRLKGKHFMEKPKERILMRQIYEDCTERESLFYAWCNGPMLGGKMLGGKMLFVPRGIRCRPIRAHEDRALLVRFTESKQRHWFAWIHA